MRTVLVDWMRSGRSANPSSVTVAVSPSELVQSTSLPLTSANPASVVELPLLTRRVAPSRTRAYILRQAVPV